MRRILETTHFAIVSFSMVLLISVSAPSSSLAQESCTRLIAEANDAYSNGQLDAVLQRTTACLDRRPSSSDRESVFMLQARVFLAQDDMTQAQDAARRLLQVNPDFTPAVDDPERFRTLVTTIKRELAREGVSSVSKMTESVPEAPATVVVVTGDQIRQRGYQDLEEVLHDLPGFDISRINGQSYSNVYQRGYRSNATNRTLFLVDGVEQNDLHSNIAYISRQYPLSNIDRIEVVYGPASTMYGANAFLGVINVLTLDPDDMLTEGKALAGDVRVGGGSWSTKSFDGTFAGRFRRASFSLTGRVFRSDEWDLSEFNEWRYDYNQDQSRYNRKFGTDPWTFLNRVTVANPAMEAMRLDRASLSLNGAAVGYSDLTDDWMISGKLKLNEFLVGLQMWQTREGAASASTQWAEPGALNGNIWSPRQTSFYARYSTALSGSLRLSYFGQAKVHELNSESSRFLLQSYASGPLQFSDIGDSTPAFWAETRLAQSSSQWRNEVNVLYRGRRNLSVVGGIDLRYGSVQKDYSKAANCEVDNAGHTEVSVPDPLAILKSNPANLSDFDLFVYWYPVMLGIYEQAPKFLKLESDRKRCNPLDEPPIRPVDGGEHVTVRDFGVFGQASFNPAPDVKLVAGLRIDNGHVNIGSSYGTIPTPRLAFVYSPRQFVFKAIYAEAFKDPASLERFSSIPGILEQSRDLKPEHVRSIEASVSHQSASRSMEVTAYRASYRDVIGIERTDLYALLNSREHDGFSDKLAQRWYYSYCALVDCFIQALEQIPAADQRTVVKEFLNFSSATNYRNGASLTVWGSQLTASWRTHGMELFGNYTYTYPKSTEAMTNVVQIGAIARHQGTIGVAGSWRNLNGNMRANIAGARKLESSGLIAFLASQGSEGRVEDPLTGEPTDSPEIDPYAVVNAAVTYEFAPGWAVQTTINNIFSTSYAHPGIQAADNERFAARVPQPGRSAFIRLLTRF